MNVNWIGLQTFILEELGRVRRVWIQTLVTPWISALLYILIFGQIIGRRIGIIDGVSYIDFVVPGLLMLNVMQSSAKHIEEILVAPLSYLEMIAGYVIGGVVRGLLVAAGVYGIALLFTVTSVNHIALFIFYAVAVALIFSLAGLLIGLWSESFEQLMIPQTFVIMPLTFLGGLFSSIHMLPERFQFLVRMNPFFYFVDGLRYSMVGISESNQAVGVALIFGLVLGLGFWVWYLFKIGYKIRT
ncbi:MAG: ABC-2 type transporter [Parcubacteria group bacterium GW2011_GWB1_44_7]|nr:MAG: ABC-2 type transporter [Parcubacteria group bacterium GW2011_GWB1_44_7]